MIKIIGYALLFYILFNLMFSFLGLADGMRVNYESGCAKNKDIRIDYVVPGYDLGCWLMEETDNG